MIEKRICCQTEGSSPKVLGGIPSPEEQTDPTCPPLLCGYGKPSDFFPPKKLLIYLWSVVSAHCVSKKGP